MPTPAAAMKAGDDAMSSEEAEDFLGAAVVILARLEDLELDPQRAIPRAVMTAGEAQLLISALIVLVTLRFPQLVDEDDKVPDLAALRYRARN